MADETYPTAANYLPEEHTYESLSTAAQKCEGCPLHRNAEQVVFGEGPTDADLVLVGESPGRDEDRQGRPFVGEAGTVLDDANLERSSLYVTNAVKHVKWDGRKGRRTPQPPDVQEIEACRPWLEAEIDLVEPELVVALGKRAARSLLDRSVTISDVRGDVQESDYGPVRVTYHPAAALRNTVEEERERIYHALVDDLESALDLT
jgi:DNA polymerase